MIASGAGFYYNRNRIGGDQMELKHVAQREGKLVSFLRQELGLSATLTSRLKFQNAYRVNGETVHVHQRVHPGDIITVTMDEAAPDYPAEEGPLDILYEDEALIVLDKPAGVMMHPTFNRQTGTLANRLLFYYETTGQHCAIHLVNRLDRDTFGVVLIAKSAHTHALLCQSLQTGRIRKTYHAAVFGSPAQDAGRICLPIARLSPTSLLRCVREDGQEAVTDYRVLMRQDPCTLLELTPVTGRTHQLRVHCAACGFPILGDPQYGTEASQRFSLAHGALWQQLCAVRLSFPHPMTGELCTVSSKQQVALPSSPAPSPAAPQNAE